MKRDLWIDFDDQRKPNIVQIGAEPDKGANPWSDLAVLMEAVGALAGIVRNGGKTEHNDVPLDAYLHTYLDKVLKDYDDSYTKVH